MEWGYEERFDILVIMLKEKYDFERSVEVMPNFIVDIAKGGEVVAIEIIDWAKQFHIPKPRVNQMKITPNIEYDEKIIISRRGQLPFHNGKSGVTRGEEGVYRHIIKSNCFYCKV